MALIFMSLLLAAGIFGCGTKAGQEPEAVPAAENAVEETAGGWTVNRDETVGFLPEKVQEAFDKAMKDYTGMGFRPVAYLGSQVVAGLNHAILCRGTMVTANPVTKLKVVTVYEMLDGSAEITNVTDFDPGHFAYAEDTGKSQEMLAGGWTEFTDQPAVNLPAEVEKALEDALNGLTGAGYEPLAYLASQVVAGMNYSILCRQTLVTAEPVVRLAVVTVNTAPDGTSSLVNIAGLNLAELVG